MHVALIKSKVGSVQMLEYIMEANVKLSSTFQDYGISWEKDKQFISELITGVSHSDLKQVNRNL